MICPKEKRWFIKVLQKAEHHVLIPLKVDTLFEFCKDLLLILLACVCVTYIHLFCVWRCVILGIIGYLTYYHGTHSGLWTNYLWYFQLLYFLFCPYECWFAVPSQATQRRTSTSMDGKSSQMHQGERRGMVMFREVVP